MTCVVRNISFWLLMQDEETKKIIEDNDELAFEKILYEKWGVDTGELYEIKSCKHRPLEQDPFTFNGPIVLGVERQDSEYLKSGKASFEAQVAAKGDISLQSDIARIGRQGCSDKTFSNRDVAKKVVNAERMKEV